MLFGAGTGTVLGKSLGGYADGREDPFDGAPCPMARFLLDEPTNDGEESLTLEVTQAQYAQLMPGQSGRLSWWGKKLSDFVAADAAGEPLAEELPPKPMEPTLPPEEQPDEQPPEPAKPIPEPDEPPAVVAPQPSPAPEIAPLSPPRVPKQQTCPWCGKTMDIWRMNSRDGFVAKRGESFEFTLENVTESVKESVKNFLVLMGGEEQKEPGPVNKIHLAEGSDVLLHLCETCKKAVIDYN